MTLAMMNPKEIKIHPTFAALFPIKADLLRIIEANMREEGYDESQPVLLARWKGQEDLVCIDGHARLVAAANAGIEGIPVSVREFDDEVAALRRAILGRVNRQGGSLTDAEIFRIVRLLHNLNSKASGVDAEFSGLGWVRNTARLLRSSSQKLEKALTVHERGAPAMVRAVEEGKISIHKAAQEMERLRRLPPPLFPDLPTWRLTSLTESIPQQG